MGHHCCSKQKVKRGLWSPEEDEKLVRQITTHGHGCWSSVPKLAGTISFLHFHHACIIILFFFPTLIKTIRSSFHDYIRMPIRKDSCFFKINE